MHISVVLFEIFQVYLRPFAWALGHSGINISLGAVLARYSPPCFRSSHLYLCPDADSSCVIRLQVLIYLLLSQKRWDLEGVVELVRSGLIECNGL